MLCIGEVADTGAQLVEVYLIGKGVFQLPKQCLTKFQQPGAQVYSLQEGELGRAVSCDYFLQQIEVERRDGTKLSVHLYIFSLLNMLCLKVRCHPNNVKSTQSTVANGTLIPLIKSHLKNIDIAQMQVRT
jgi:hypothetical protein